MVLEIKDRVLIKSLYRPKLQDRDQKLESSSTVLSMMQEQVYKSPTYTRELSSRR